jgi:hypothetical protein
VTYDRPLGRKRPWIRYSGSLGTDQRHHRCSRCGATETRLINDGVTALANAERRFINRHKHCVERSASSAGDGTAVEAVDNASSALLSDPKPTGDPARDAQLHGGDCWLIEGFGGSPGPWWFDREAWVEREGFSFTSTASEALAFPTKAEAEMFAREYLPELEGRVQATEHRFVAPLAERTKVEE